MTSSRHRDEQAPPRAHYRERHMSLNDLPPQSTEHGFRSRVNKTSDENLRLQARLPPSIGVFSVVDFSVHEQAQDEISPGGRNSQRRRPRPRHGAATFSRSPTAPAGLPLHVQIGPPVPTNNYPKVAISEPCHGMQQGPLSPSRNSDDTPVSATDPHPYPFQDIYTMGSVSNQHYDNGGVQYMGYPTSGFPNDFMTFEPELQAPLTDPSADLYQGGSILTDYPPPHSYTFDGSVIQDTVFYHQENNALSEYSSVAPVNFSASQFAHPSSHIASATANRGGGSNYMHGGGHYRDYYTPNYDQ